MNASSWLVLLVLLLLGGAAAVLWIRAEGTPPALEAPDALLVGAQGASLAIAVSDGGSGLRELRVSLLRADGETTLLEETYPGNLLSGGLRKQHAVEIPLAAERLREVRGEAVIRVATRDWSWRGFFSGNEALADIPLSVDL